MLFLDGVYIDRSDGSARFRWIKAPTREELTQLAHTIASRVGRFLERQGLLERDADDCMDAGGTPPGMEAVDRVGNKRSRATPGAVAGNAGAVFPPHAVLR